MCVHIICMSECRLKMLKHLLPFSQQIHLVCSRLLFFRKTTVVYSENRGNIRNKDSTGSLVLKKVEWQNSCLTVKL
jgi:hypothetical protein